MGVSAAYSRNNSAAFTEYQAQNKALQEQLKEAKEKGEEEVERIRDNYNRQSAAEYDRYEKSIDNKRAGNYEKLSDLQRAQQREISQASREGDRKLTETKAMYNQQVQTQEQAGKERLEKIKTEREAAIGTEQVQGARELELARDINKKNKELTKGEIDNRREQIRAFYDKKAGEEAAATTQALENNVQMHEQKRQENLEKHQRELSLIEKAAQKKIQTIRQDTAQKLAAYANRQSDPFYQMVDLGSEFRETSEAFILTTQIPKHEQGNISVSVRGNQLVLSGFRKNEEKLGLGEGRDKTSASFQSFTESFPINWPVDAKRVLRESDGDQLTIIVPKKGVLPNNTKQTKRDEKPRPIDMAKAQFPTNLPLPESVPELTDPKATKSTLG